MSDKKEKTYNSDITKEDLNALGKKTKNTRTDQGDDQQLNEREKDVDFAGFGLDVPGRNLPKNKNKNKKTIKDEENQLYSQGGSGNEDLERNRDHIK